MQKIDKMHLAFPSAQNKQCSREHAALRYTGCLIVLGHTACRDS